LEVGFGSRVKRSFAAEAEGRAARAKTAATTVRVRRQVLMAPTLIVIER